MYVKSASYYDAIYAFRDYAAGAAAIEDVVRERMPSARSLLDVACGTALHLEHWREELDVEGLDLSPELLRIAATRCPGVPLHQADMTDFHLGRQFDVVTCLFSAIAYVRTLDRARSAIASMAAHLRPGGLLLLEPWFTPESYWVGHLTSNVVERPELKISWMYVSALRGKRMSVLDIHFQVGTPSGIDQFHEVHEMGLFTDAEYRNAMADAALATTYRRDATFSRGLYIGRKKGVAGGTHP